MSGASVGAKRRAAFALRAEGALLLREATGFSRSPQRDVRPKPRSMVPIPRPLRSETEGYRASRPALFS
jgi:hypothetical protein